MTPAPELTIWTDAVAAPAVGAMLEALGPIVHPLAVAGPRLQDVADLARQLNLPREDDLRKLLVHYPAAYLLLGTATGVTVEHLATAAEHDTRVVSLEPVAEDLPTLAALAEHRARKPGHHSASPYEHIVHVPAFTAAPGYVSAADPRDALGQHRTISFQSVGQRGQGSLFARLFDAWRTVLALAPMPLTIDGALTTDQLDIPDNLRQITGSLTAHARLPEAGAILIDVADHAGATHRHLHALGDAGQLRVTDTGYTLHQTTGELLDRANPFARLPFAELVAHHWRSLPDAGAPPAGASHHDDAQALACCLACLLSARTAASEDPRRILEINA